MKRGEVWRINLDPTVGAEIRTTRPGLIMSADEAGALPLRVIVPITGWQEHYAEAPWLVRLDPTDSNGLEKPSAADAFQLKSLSVERFVEQAGKVASGQMEHVEEAVRLVLAL